MYFTVIFADLLDPVFYQPKMCRRALNLEIFGIPQPRPSKFRALVLTPTYVVDTLQCTEKCDGGEGGVMYFPRS